LEEKPPKTKVINRLSTTYQQVIHSICQVPKPKPKKPPKTTKTTPPRNNTEEKKTATTCRPKPADPRPPGRGPSGEAPPSPRHTPAQEGLGRRAKRRDYPNPPEGVRRGIPAPPPVLPRPGGIQTDAPWPERIIDRNKVYLHHSEPPLSFPFYSMFTLTLGGIYQKRGILPP